MSLVKKLQSGGTVDPNALNIELDNQISQFQLRSKDERRVRDALGKFRDYMSTGDKSLTVDPVTKQYTLTGQGSEAFQGSPDEIERNWFSGNLKIKDDQDAMSVAAAIYNKALNNVGKAKTTTAGVATPTEKEKATLGNISDYITNSIYGTADNFEADVKNLTDPEQRKQKYLGWANQRLDEYIANAGKNAETFDYTDLQTAQNLKNLIAEGNWDKIKSEMYKLKWEPDKFINPEVDEEEQKKKQAESQIDVYNKIGISNPELQKTYSSLGYTKVANDWLPENIGEDATWFRDELTKAGASILENPQTGKHIIVTPSGEFKYMGTDPLGKGYGYTIASDASGVHINKPEYNRQAGVFGADPNASSAGNYGRQLITDLPGEVYGWSNEKDGKFNVDILGRRDYTQQIVQEMNGIKKVWTKDPITGLYKDEQGNEKQINIQGFGTNKRVITDYTDILTQKDNPLSNIKAASYYRNTDDFLTDLSSEIDSINKLGEHDEEKLNKLAAHARYLIARGTPEEKRIALEQYLKLSQLFKSNNISINNNFIRTVGSFKIGGKIRKGQKGMTAEEYRAKYSSVSPEGQFRKSMNKAEMIKNAGWNDALSGAGLALSFIPGLGGVIGGTIITASDIIKDVQKDGFQWSDVANLNTMANLGFTALSGVGLGGLRALGIGAKAVKAAKAASEAEKVVKVSKFGRLADKVGGVVKGKPLETVNKALGSKWTRRAMVAGLATQSLPSAYQSFTSAPEDMGFWDKMGRIKTSDAKNALMATNLMNASRIGKNMKNAVLKHTTSEGAEAAIKTNTINGKTYQVIDDITLPSILKGQFKKKDQLEKIKNSIETNVIGDAETKKQAVIDILGSDDVAKQVIPKDIIKGTIPGKEGVRTLKEAPTDKAELSEYNLAKKVMEKNITNPGQPYNVKDAVRKVKNLVTPKYMRPSTSNITPTTVTPETTPVVTKAAENIPEATKTVDTIKETEKALKIAKPKRKPRAKAKSKNKDKAKSNESNINLNKQGGILKFQGGGFAPLSGTTFGVAPKVKQAGKDIFKNINFDATDIANALMYAKTVRTNRQVGDLQRQAIADSMTSLPTMGRKYIRETSPYSMLGESEAGKVTSKVGRIASSTSDLDRSIGAQLEGTRQTADIRARYNMENQERLDALRGQQLQLDITRDKYNLATVSKNKLATAEALQKMKLVSANQQLAQNTAFGNLTTSYARNLPIKQYKQTLGELNEASKDPKLKALSDEYTQIASPEYEAKAKADYEAKLKLSPNDVKTPWESSIAKKNLDALIKQKYDQIMVAKQPYENLSNELSYKRALLFAKSGGSLSKADRLEIEERKSESRRKEKDKGMFYKAIMHNNEMLYKSLIKVFK